MSYVSHSSKEQNAIKMCMSSVENVPNAGLYTMQIMKVPKIPEILSIVIDSTSRQQSILKWAKVSGLTEYFQKQLSMEFIAFMLLHLPLLSSGMIALWQMNTVLEMYPSSRHGMLLYKRQFDRLLKDQIPHWNCLIIFLSMMSQGMHLGNWENMVLFKVQKIIFAMNAHTNIRELQILLHLMIQLL